MTKIAIFLGLCAMASCNGEAADSSPCTILQPSTSQPCVYSVPANLDCPALQVWVDEGEQNPPYATLQCSSDPSRSIVWLQPNGQETCSKSVVKVCPI